MSDPNLGREQESRVSNRGTRPEKARDDAAVLGFEGITKAHHLRKIGITAQNAKS